MEVLKNGRHVARAHPLTCEVMYLIICMYMSRDYIAKFYRSNVSFRMLRAIVRSQIEATADRENLGSQ